MNETIRRALAGALTLLLVLGPGANAGVISTGMAIQSDVREQRLDRVESFLARDDVRSALIAYGVSPDDASRRTLALTDAELQQLASRIDQLPSGGIGVIEVIGVVAVVLLVLELLGVTNVFTRF